jgi:soluble lytic murein transglycosylase-like protein
MTNSTSLWLIALGVTGMVAAATSAGAEMRTTSDRSASLERARDAAYQRVGYKPRPPAASRRAPARNSRAYWREIAEASALYGVPERLIWAVITVESGFDHRAVSRSGAQGLMQLMPETAAILGVRDPFDPRENIHAGTRHLRAMMMRFRSDLRLAVAAYNAGARPVVAYRGVPPYPETRQYVAQVLRLYRTPGAWSRSSGRDVHRLARRDGTVVYTNIPYGQVASQGR